MIFSELHWWQLRFRFSKFQLCSSFKCLGLIPGPSHLWHRCHRTGFSGKQTLRWSSVYQSTGGALASSHCRRKCFISWVCHDKVPQTDLLKTAESYSLTILEGEVWNQGVNRAVLLPKALGNILFLASSSFRWLSLPTAPCSCGCSLQPLHPSPLDFLLPLLLCVPLFSMSLIRTPVIGFGTHLDNPGWSHLESLI